MTSTIAAATASLTLAPWPHVEFGAGSIAHLPRALALTGRTRAFVVSDPGVRACGVLAEVEKVLDAAGIEYSTFSEVEANPSVATIDRAGALARAFGDAAVIAVGGGSSLDAAKGIALAAVNDASAATFDFSGEVTPGLPLIAVPTTSGTGAETNGFGVIEDTACRRKVYLGDDSVVPRVCLLDPALTVGLPARVTAATGSDALVHAVESLTSRGRNAVSEAYAHRAAALVYSALPTAVADGTDLDARAALMLGSHLAGRALTLSGLGLVHGIAHSVTAQTGTPHGVALSAVLGDVLEFNLATSAAEYAGLAADLGVADSTADVDGNARRAVAACRGLVEQVGSYRPLSELGCSEQMIEGLADATLADAVTRNTPRMPSRDELCALLQGAL